MKFFEICAEVLVPKFTRAEVRLPDLKSIFRIFYYSTASIGGKVYIFGGSPVENRILEYNDDQWRDYGSLLTGRHTLGSISFNSKTMILGLQSNILPNNE